MITGSAAPSWCRYAGRRAQQKLTCAQSENTSFQAQGRRHTGVFSQNLAPVPRYGKLHSQSSKGFICFLIMA